MGSRHSWFKRRNIDPMVTWRVSQTTPVKVLGEFMREEGFKPFGDNALPRPFVLNGPTTSGLRPRDFTFSDPLARAESTEKAAFAALAARIPPLPVRVHRLEGGHEFPLVLAAVAEFFHKESASPLHPTP